MSRRSVFLLSALFALSGAAALVYQVTWQRILALHTGVGVYSVAMIVASFMAGLGLGSHWGGVASTRLTPKASLRLFTVIEIAIGLFAASSSYLYYDVLYLKAQSLYAPAWRAGILHFLALVFPTTLMGMSLPLLTRATVSDTPTAGRTIGTLYALNVAGAAVGALATPWVLVRLWGIRGAILCGVLCNVVAGLGALGLGRKAFAPSPPRKTALAGAGALGRWALLYGLSGFCALALEILWFRVVDVAVRSTAFTFGSVLFIYLVGLALGSYVGARMVDRTGEPLRLFLACQCAILSYAAGGMIVLNTHFSTWFRDYWATGQFVLGSAWEPGTIVRLYVALPACLYGPPTVLMGLSFALLQRAVQDDPETAGRKVGFLQAANIAGNVAGSLLVGLVFLSLLGTPGTLRILVAAGSVFALLGIRSYGVRSLFSGALVLMLVLFLSTPNAEQLWSPLHGVEKGRGLIEEDATSVVALKPEGSGWRLLVNGHRHSWIPFGGIHSWLGAIPAIMHPSPRRAAIVGLGSGDTAWAAACREETEDVRVFEIAAPEQTLLRRFAPIGQEPQLLQLLGDRRIRIQTADGRIALLTDDTLFDLIVVDALRPTSAGSGNLYSIEFFERASRKLRPGGLVATWVPTPRVAATFRRAFPHSVNVRNGEMLIGSIHPIEIDVRRWQSRLSEKRLRDYLGPRLTEEIEESLTFVKPTLRRESPESEINRDLFPRDEFLVPR